MWTALGAGRDASQFALSRRANPTNTVGGFIASKFAAERSRYKARRLLPAGFLRTASQTAEAGIVPPSWDDPELVTTVDDYWLKELLDAHAREFGAKAGLNGVRIFEMGLRTIFSDKRRSYGSTLWRPAIEVSPQNLDLRAAENRFVEGMRDALEGWIEASQDVAKDYVTLALRDEAEIIRRIALHTVTEHFEILRPGLESVIAPQLFTSGHRHELYRLLSERFGELSVEGKAAVIEAIRNLPLPTKGEDPERRLKYTQRDWLSSIRNHPEAAAWFSEFATDPELGPLSEHPDFLSYHEMRAGPGPTPFSTDSLIAFAEDGSLVERLNGFTETDSWRGPTLGGLVAAL